MKFLVKILIGLLAFVLAGIMITLHINNTLTNPKQIDQALKRSGSYDYIAKQVSTSINTEIEKSASPDTIPVLKASVEKTITPQIISGVIVPPLSSLVDWFKNGSAGLPPLSIDTTSINQAIISAAQSQVDAQKQAEVKFELTRILPPNISLTQVNEATQQTNTKPLENIQSVYAQLSHALVIQIGLAILLVSLIVFMSLTNKPRILRRPAIASFLAAFLVAFLSWPVLFLLSHTLLAPKSTTGDNQQLIEIARGLSTYILAGLAPYAIGLTVAGIILLVGSFFIPKPHKDKK